MTLFNSNIYEVNIRQYTPEGSFQAFQKHLPRLKDMGVEILWLMPIHPIGLKNRKGTLGSYYSISDFKTVNPEFGTMDDFGQLVNAIHASGMKVIMDWVANHAAWDNVWTVSNPDFFERDDAGEFISPFDWTDVIQIDHKNERQQEAMIEAMAYWVNRFNINGFRADLAHLTPLSFWKKARRKLDATKEGLIWLAETEEPSYHEAFDISFTWKWMHATEKVYKQNGKVQLLADVLNQYKIEFPPQAYRLFFTSNHDENSWNGTEFEKYHYQAEMLAVFSFVYAGIPLIYSGQEIPNTRRLAFFEKDALQWEGQPLLHDFYKRLCILRKELPGLHFNDTGRMSDVFSIDDQVLSFFRGEEPDQLFLLFNFGKKECKINYSHPRLNGNFEEVFSLKRFGCDGELKWDLPSGGYAMFRKLI